MDKSEEAQKLFICGMEAYRAKDYTKALALLKQAAELGDDTAIENVARSYRDGTGVEKSGEKALEWYKKIAYYPTKYPHREIILEIAKIYRDGVGSVKSDGEEAVKWLREIEDSQVVQLIAEIYRDGLGLPADGEKAVEEFKKLLYPSVEYPYGERTAEACLCIARIYRDGVGNIQQSNKEYLKWLRKATKPFESYFQEYPFYNRDAMIELGDVYRDGVFVRKKDCNKALYYYKQVFDHYHDNIEDSEIALRIVEIYSKGIGGVKKNPKEAEKYLAWAKELNTLIDDRSFSEEDNEH